MAREYGLRPPGYRLPDATHVGRVRLQVSDLGRSVDYYQQVTSPGDEDARLLEWELVLPDADNVAAAAASVSGSGYLVSNERGNRIVTDEWGTRLRLMTHSD